MTTAKVPNQTTRLSQRAVNRIERLVKQYFNPRLVPDTRKLAVQLHEAATGRRA